MGSRATQNGMLPSNYKIFEMNQSVKNLENAHQAFRVGRLSDAEEICREILPSRLKQLGSCLDPVAGI